jgi:hypothetical protein
MTAGGPGSEAIDEGDSGSAKRYVQAGLDLIGLDASEAELAVVEAADSLYRPLIESLLEDELDGVEPDFAPDMSGPPRGGEQR